MVPLPRLVFAAHDVVVDDRGCLNGVITVDDAMEEEVSEDMYRIAGTSERDPLHGTFLTKVSLRFPWLLLTLLGKQNLQRSDQKGSSPMT